MDIDMIEVMENNISFVIFPKEKQVLIENNYYLIMEEKIEELIRIIRTWNHEYSDNTYLDGNRFSVKVYYDNKVDEMNGLRGIPKNYEAFSMFVRSIYDRR